MTGTDILHSERASTLRDGGHGLRVRAVLFEDAKARRAKMGGRKHGQIFFDTDQALRWPTLARWVANHDGWPPSVARSSAARLRHIQAIRAAFGPVVLLRLKLPELNSFPLKSAATAAGARRAAKVHLARFGGGLLPAAWTVNVQSGEHFGGTHAHILLPLASLTSSWAALIDAAPHGRGGGLELDSIAHAVVVGAVAADLKRVAAYLSRDPDGRLDTPGTDAYFDALEAELLRKASKVRSVRLGWESGLKGLPTPSF